MFGWFKKSAPKAVTLEWTEYKGYRVAAEPVAESGQYRVGGRIEKGEGEALLSHTFVRADLIPTLDEAKSFSLKKAQMMIDQLGDRVFDS
ncbi:HlyU family transcriptional regulator [Reinekea blandensis]|nr:HlyU family transcriptional regulator [Reinekea blandensis]